MRRRRAFAKYFAYLWLVGRLLESAPTGAQPRVVVQSATALTLQTPDSPAQPVRVRLTDDAGQPLAGRAVRLELRFAAGQAQVHADRTDERGELTVRLPTRRRPQAIRASFKGDRRYRSSQAVLRDLTPPRPTLEWAAGPRALDLDRGHQRFALQVKDAPRSAVLSGTLRIQGQQQPYQARSRGQEPLRFAVPSRALPQGAFSVRVTVAAEGEPLAASTRHFTGFLQPRIRLQARAAPADGSVRVTGRLSSARGPLGGRTVALYLGPTRLRQLATAADGRFAARLAKRDRPPAERLVARFDPEEPGLRQARSRAIAWPSPTVAPSPRPWIPWALAAITALLLGGLRLRSRSRTRLPAATGPSEPRQGLQRPRPHLDRARCQVISGVVLDEALQRPIAGASVEVLCHGQRCCGERTDAHGRFTTPALPAGTYQMIVRCTGYFDEHHTVTSPHRGDLTGLTVRLLSARTVVFRDFKSLVAQVMEARADRPAPTPRDLADWSAHSRNITLHDLAMTVERALFGQGAPSPDTATRLQGALQRMAEKAMEPKNEKTQSQAGPTRSARIPHPH